MASLFESRVKPALKITFLEAKKKAEDARMDEAQEKIDLYQDDFEEIIRSRMEQLFEKANYERLYYHVNHSQNVIKRIVNEISTVYKSEAKRMLSKKCERYDELKAKVNYDVILKKVNRYTNLLNESMLKIGIRNGEICYDLITPNITMVIQNEQDPTEADAIMYSLTRVNTLFGRADEIRWFYWDIEGSHYILNEDMKIIEAVYEEDSPYFDKKADKFILPFVVFHRQHPDYSFWDQDTGRDLYNAALAISINMTMFDYYYKTCSFRQRYAIGDTSKIPQNQLSDPLTFFALPADEGATIGTLEMQVDIEQLVKAITFQINGIINNYGISADMYSLEIPEMSGRALKIRNRTLMELRQEQLPLYLKYEKETYEKTRIINNAWPRFLPKMNEQAEFSIDFGEIEFPDDPMEEIELQTKKLRAGIISLPQFYQFFNPDIKDEKEAEKVIIANLQALQDLGEKYPNVDKTLDYILGEGWKQKPAAEPEEEVKVEE